MLVFRILADAFSFYMHSFAVRSLVNEHLQDGYEPEGGNESRSE